MASVATVINEYGAALRHDWSDFDGRSARDDLALIAEHVRQRGNQSLDDTELRELRNRIGVCLVGDGHWQEHCDESCETDD